MALDFDKIQNRFIRMHLEYVAETEPPKLFHTFAGLTAVGAAMGRHVYLETGIGRLYGNMYTLLVGPPATKKSTAIRLATTLMRTTAGIKWAPDDTGGQRQGLIAALVEEDLAESDGDYAAEALDLDALSRREVDLSPIEDRHVMFANASEFGSFIGQNSTDYTRFLIKMWDGDDFVYQLRNAKDTLREPLLTILGGTTPTDIATLLPPEAIGQGFMSRCILVYASNKEKVVPPSKVKLAKRLENELAAVYGFAWRRARGPMKLDKDAERLLDILYETELKIQDNRFIYYTERRSTHLTKLAMTLAIAEQRLQITQHDVEEAHRILTAAELRMPDALGEYGLSPVAVARQKMLEYLRYAREPVSERILWAIMQKDMKLVDFQNSISALVNTGKISALDLENGRALIFNDAVTKLVAGMDDEALDALLQSDNLEISHERDGKYKTH